MKRFGYLFLLVPILLSACGGGSYGGDDNSPPPPPPPPANVTQFAVTLTTAEAFLASNPTGSASADLELKVDDNTLSGTVTLTNISADSVSLNIGFAGEVGSELLQLDSDGANSFTIPANTVLNTDELNSLDSGELFLQVSDSANPDGALRGQVLPVGLELYIADITQSEVIPPSGSAANATGYVTLNPISGDVIVRVVTENFPNANAAHIHQGLAGTNGAPLIFLSQDSSDSSLWSNEGNEEVLDSAGIDALNAGELYFNIHSPAFPGGEIRGQIVPENVEINFTPLDGDSVVVPGSSGVTTDASAVAASTFDAVSEQVSIHINTVNLGDAIAASLNQAPAGQNGPSIVDFVQDSSLASLWSAVNIAVTPSQIAALENQGLYFTVATPAFPDGEVRGQLIPENSNPGSGASFQVTSVNPANATEIEAFPASINIGFNRPVLDTSLAPDTIVITASGGDGSFNDGNEQGITGFSSSVSNSSIQLDLSGIAVNDDVFQIAIADGELTDTDGVILDGDNDGAIGGEFTSSFSVVTPSGPANPNATFSAIQNNVFTPICSVCHGGASPSAGMSLEAGQAFNNIVNVISGEQPSLLRINPGNPDDSYLIRKLEGGPGISGSRMPLGGPFLSQDIIDDIRQWISEGAQNN